MKRLLLALVFLLVLAPTADAVVARRVTVTTTATLVVSRISATNVFAMNRGSVSVYFGESDVATTTGVEVLPGEGLKVLLRGNEPLYAIVASSTARVDVIEVSQ